MQRSKRGEQSTHCLSGSTDRSARTSWPAKKVAPARLPRADILYPLETEQRKQINRQIAGKAIIDREHFSVARASAVQQRKGLARLLLLLPSNRR